MLSRENFIRLIKEVWGEIGEENEVKINEMIDDYDERDGIMRKYGEFKEVEDEYTFNPFDFDDYKVKYDELREKYKERFFGEGKTKEEVIEQEKEDVSEDDDVKEISELFKKEDE